jgi:hypothetical protein
MTSWTAGTKVPSLERITESVKTILDHLSHRQRNGIKEAEESLSLTLTTGEAVLILSLTEGDATLTR